jgi:hypothetical protein
MINKTRDQDPTLDTITRITPSMRARLSEDDGRYVRNDRTGSSGSIRPRCCTPSGQGARCTSRFVPHSQTIIVRSALEDDLLSVDRQPPRSQPPEVVGSTFGTASRVSSAPAAEAVHSSTQTLARAPLTTCFRSSVRLLP